jgi:hypothetical protein
LGKQGILYDPLALILIRVQCIECIFIPAWQKSLGEKALT